MTRTDAFLTFAVGDDAMLSVRSLTANVGASYDSDESSYKHAFGVHVINDRLDGRKRSSVAHTQAVGTPPPSIS